jgi:hypothetical protein
MKLDELTIGEAKQLAALFGGAKCVEHPYNIGGKYFIRTVTHHLTGRLVYVGEHELALEEAAWIADDGRFTPALAEGKFAEVEPFPPSRVIVGRGSVIDAVEIACDLPRAQR